ncbi:M81 family metallopeptidase [Pseudoroseicyclus aestuarii]|uniref:Microcystin degradation protein MlrC n=1 Tax=Pseudoroseicyclus aestuarii TaxID=1795041 RepID=A0A318SW03_9RHOB|nr:M81 family metallopeptidase [Pseudoroseicyclus aestuarii]PYE85672.1 microcystin degradation protein MlrC [Pseudoroseicyclus aestuarii]
MRIAIGGLHTECSSYNPLHQRVGDFTVTEGADLTARAHHDFGAIEAVPLVHYRSVPGGPVAPEAWAAMTGDLLGRLRAAQEEAPLDGVLLLMHGAMYVPDVADPEGWLIGEVRQIVGPEAILSAGFDLHGQMTPAIAETLDAFAAYRTAPHVDVEETAARASRMLEDALTGGPRPMVVRRPVPILVPGEMSSTFVEPCAGLYAALPGFDERRGVLDANLMIGYVWADIARATAAAMVTCTDRAAGEAAAEEIAQSYWDARERLAFDVEAGPLDALLASLGDGYTILADSGDNPTAGGVGDRADVIEAVLERGIEGALFAGIADPAAYKALQEGATSVEIGGSLGGGGPRLVLPVEGLRFAMGCAVLRTRGITVVISERRRPFHNMADFVELGLDLRMHPLLVVKSGYLSPDVRMLPGRQVMALTPGAVSQDLSALENRHRPEGTFPFAR